MNLAILHYHLNRGGVTRVIANHLAAIDAHLIGERFKVAILFGGRRKGWPDELPSRLPSLDVSLHELPRLDYDAPGALARPDLLADEIARCLNGVGMPPRETVLHAHNHSLGKNVSLPGAIGLLAGAGYAILLQVHDFAEDFRPASFCRLREAATAARATKVGRAASSTTQQASPQTDVGACYPQAPHIHYAALNRRDESVLAGAGVPDARRHLLPNPVAKSGELPAYHAARGRLEKLFDVATSEQFVVYPVRGIRRKNLGETLLWAMLAQNNSTFAVTLPPLNPNAREVYEAWKRSAAEYGLSCRFELGREPDGLAFEESVAAADFLITTSLAEGFGMVFLESWLAGRALVGRDLPEITVDFTLQGLRLDSMRSQLLVPLDLLDAAAFGEMLTTAYGRVVDQFGVFGQDGSSIGERIKRRIDEGRVDFGELDEALQHEVLRRAATDGSARQRLLDLNPHVEASLRVRGEDAAETITDNAKVVRERFGFDAGGRRLLSIYRQVADSDRRAEPQPLPQAASILDAFLDPQRFRPICT